MQRFVGPPLEGSEALCVHAPEHSRGTTLECLLQHTDRDNKRVSVWHFFGPVITELDLTALTCLYFLFAAVQQDMATTGLFLRGRDMRVPPDIMDKAEIAGTRTFI